jgi:hypothetical protein
MHALVEVFAVQVTTKTLNQLERICGLILIRGSEQNYVLYEDIVIKGPQYNSEGHSHWSRMWCGSREYTGYISLAF